jgi:hypothetical protein
MLDDELRAVLGGYDGRSPTMLSEAAAWFGGEPGYLDALVALAADGDRPVAEGATWMLKAALEQGRALNAAQTARLMDGLERISAWQAQLHLCQIAGRLGVSVEDAARFRAWLSPLLDAARPFLRAWALDALCRVQAAGPETDGLLERMAGDPAGSVRARVRNLRAERAKTRAAG